MVPKFRPTIRSWNLPPLLNPALFTANNIPHPQDKANIFRDHSESIFTDIITANSQTQFHFMLKSLPDLCDNADISELFYMQAIFCTFHFFSILPHGNEAIYSCTIQKCLLEKSLQLLWIIELYCFYGKIRFLPS